MQEILGYQPKSPSSSPCYIQWPVKYDGDIPRPADYKIMGKLLTIITQKDFFIYDLTLGGKIEGDLMEPDYHQVALFKKLKDTGYDGVKINDFAQTKMWGNMGHRSIGLFPKALANVEIEVSDAYHEENF